MRFLVLVLRKVYSIQTKQKYTYLNIFGNDDDALMLILFKDRVNVNATLGQETVVRLVTTPLPNSNTETGAGGRDKVKKSTEAAVAVSSISIS